MSRSDKRVQDPEKVTDNREREKGGHPMDELTNTALSLFPVQCVHRVSEIRQEAPHSHYGYEFYFCQSGHGNFIAGDRVYEMLAGSLVIVSPLVLHMPRPAPGQPLHRLILSVDKNYLSGLCRVDRCSQELISEWLPRKGEGSLARQLNIGQLESVKAVLLELEKELADKRDGYPLAVRSLLLRLFLELVRQEVGKPAVGTADESKKRLAEEIIRYIAARYKEPFHLDEMCRHFYLSRSYLYRIFKRETGISIQEYVMAYRINRAKELLETEQMPLVEVAAASGFPDLSHFCHSFKRLTGVTPGRYRTLLRRHASRESEDPKAENYVTK